MNATFAPWDLHPDLTAARLQGIASIIRKVRSEAARTHEPSHGDDAWVLGCRGYMRTCFALKSAAADGLHGIVIHQNAHVGFVFALGDSPPLRFYRGEPDEPPSRTLRRTFPELRWTQLGLQLNGLMVPGLLRLAVELQDSGEVDQVTLVQLTEEGTILNRYEIGQVEETKTQVTSFPAALKAGIEIPEPSVLDTDMEQETKTDEE